MHLNPVLKEKKTITHKIQKAYKDLNTKRGPTKADDQIKNNAKLADTNR